MPTETEIRATKGQEFVSKKYPKAGFGDKSIQPEQQNPIVFIKLDFKKIEEEYIDPEKKKERVNFGDTNNTETPVGIRKLRDSILDHMFTNKHTETDKTNIKNSLDLMMLYLFNPQEPYPTWFRYYAFRNLLDLAPYTYNQEKKTWEFPKRSKNTTKPFPELNSGALAYIQQMHDASHDESFREEINTAMGLDAPQEDILTQEKVDAFINKPFREQYREGIEKNGTITPELLDQTKGEWIKYDKGSNAIPLWRSLQNKGTGWCTAGLGTAKEQLEDGDFYVYYTPGQDEKFTTPRIAIRMEEDEIAEIRGISKNQNLEHKMVDPLSKKIEKDFGNKAQEYKTKLAHTMRLTEIQEKQTVGTPLSKEDLCFLYEKDNDIQGFGYRRDPNIQKIIDQRNNTREDLTFIFDTTKDRISLTKEEALSGNMHYHHGNLDLSGLTSAEGLLLPKIIKGYLNLNGLTSAEGLNLPEEGVGELHLKSITSAEGLLLPKIIKGYLNLNGLTSAEGLNLPEEGVGSLLLESLTSAEGLLLPKIIKGYLSLNGLTSAEGLNLPEEVVGKIQLPKDIKNQIPEESIKNLNIIWVG